MFKISPSSQMNRMRPIWSGSIAFGMVNIPIKLYAAIESHSVGFHLLHNKDNSPIEYKHWCKKEDKEVPWSEIVRGLEIEDNEYYVFTKQDIQNLKAEKTDYITINEFIDTEQIDPIYYDKHYYMTPAKPKEKAYFLFHDVLQTKNKLAVGTFVMREKEYIAAISSYKAGMQLTTLNYAYEIRDITSLPELTSPIETTKPELDLASQLIDKMTDQHFTINKYQDTYTTRLKEEIKRKGTPIKAPEIERPTETKEENLIEALKASIQ
jgi:DNA end-binding protein Ku